MGSQHLGLFCCMLICSCEGLTGRSSLSPYIRHYEGLSYDRPGVHRQRHLLTKRATSPHQDRRALQLNFTAFHREFRLRLRRDTTGFSEEFKVVDEKGAIAANLSHLYSGTLEGEQDASCHGSLLLGQFEGSVRTSNGTYHIEPLHRYTSRPDEHHSIIYHEDDMDDAMHETKLLSVIGLEGSERMG
ncbi:disintegrin and metalloproteinase domain-containing protein 10 isoform X2 [Gadus macrocephalus]|uniref:disintegrin and metalloproteinase domain-containing protein 10 isoform X2 n=1 Tax=Gadus macrocephalus TaxID=80720 RepID=UPI0028CB4BF6|nr:disintegrin and metalloproteinase domain-containing protein 10 isoform X2 [Gadus macrocephalus]